jgi:hypothetical protein
MRIKPSIFIGSSSEFTYIANELKALLEATLNVSVTVWDDPLGVFRLGRNITESILTAPHFFDYSMLILGPDDTVTSRGSKAKAPRDNVIFELGFFLGSQGRTRAFAVVLERAGQVGKKSSRIKIPSDLAGEQFLKVALSGRGKPSKPDIRKVVSRIGQSLENQKNLSYITPLPSTVLAVTYYRNFLHPMCDKLSQSRSVITGSGKKMALGKEGFNVTVAIPRTLDKASRSGQQEYKEMNTLDIFTVETETRPFPFFVALKKKSRMIEFVDVPTTLRGCSEAIRLLMPVSGATGKTAEQELVEQREVENFAETLQHIIDTDPDGQHLRKRIRLEIW